MNITWQNCWINNAQNIHLDSIAAIAGRAVHAYHAEGAGGGPYDLLEIVAQPNVIPSSTNPTIPYTINTAAEHFDMIMAVHLDVNATR